MKAKRVAVLYTPIIDKIRSLGLSKTNYNGAVKIVLTIHRETYKRDLSSLCFIPFPSTFWKKHVGSHYERCLKPLIKAGIIQTNHIYSTELHICKAYRIHPNMISDDVQLVEYRSDSPPKDNLPECKRVMKFMRELKLDVCAAKATVKQYIKSKTYQQFIEVDPDLPDNMTIKLENYELFDLSQEYYSVQFVKKIARHKGLQLIKDKQKFIIDDPDLYFQRKQNHIRWHYLDVIYRYKSEAYFARRNQTNHRLDTNISNMPNILVQHLTYKGEALASLDLSNSQFTILATLIEKGYFDLFLLNPLPIYLYFKSINMSRNINTNEISVFYQYYSLSKLYHKYHKYSINISTYMCAKTPYYLAVNWIKNALITPDIADFIDLAKNGKLYEYIQDCLGLQCGAIGRKEAKHMMFEICFSGHGNRRTTKKSLRKLFPNLVKMMDNYKQSYGNKNFPITLQKEESRIFIDRILKRLYVAGYDVISKHDSILCLRSQQRGVEEIIREILDEELGQYQLKLEEYNDGV